MSILCGTDFSEGAARAATLAAQLAAANQETLHLVHVVDLGLAQPILHEEESPLEAVRQNLQQETDRLRALGAEVQSSLRTGIPDLVLIEEAEKNQVDLMVLSAIGRRVGRWWPLGNTADRVAQASKIPVLVVRQSEKATAWDDAAKPLKVVVGFDFSFATEAALQWLGRFRQMKACDVLMTHVYWPPSEYARLGLNTPMSLIENQSEIESILLREMRSSAAKLEGKGAIEYRVLFSYGRVAEPLTEVAQQEGADLVIVGTHQRKGLDRLWHGSASRSILHHSPCSVAVVAASTQQRHVQAIPELKTALVPTDLSDFANRAIPQAIAALPPGGRLILFHATRHPLDDAQRQQKQHELLEACSVQVQTDAHRRGIQLQVEVTEDPEIGSAICQAAERLGADLICMTTHGKSGLLQTLAGSVGRDVLHRSRRPILLIRPSAQDA